jgi:hypothetical protein
MFITTFTILHRKMKKYLNKVKIFLGAFAGNQCNYNRWRILIDMLKMSLFERVEPYTTKALKFYCYYPNGRLYMINLRAMLNRKKRLKSLRRSRSVLRRLGFTLYLEGGAIGAAV